MSGTDVESMAIKRYRRGKYVVATEKSPFSTSDLTCGAVQRLWYDVQTPYSACSTRCIRYNHRESPAMVAGATPSGKSQSRPIPGKNGIYIKKKHISPPQPPYRPENPLSPPERRARNTAGVSGIRVFESIHATAIISLTGPNECCPACLFRSRLEIDLERRGCGHANAFRGRFGTWTAH